MPKGDTKTSDDPYDGKELAIIRKYLFNHGPAPSFVVNQERWIRTVDQLFRLTDLPTERKHELLYG